MEFGEGIKYGFVLASLSFCMARIRAPIINGGRGTGYKETGIRLQRLSEG